MMNRVMAGILALGMLTGPVLAGPPTPEQKSEFYASCVKTSHNNELCSCKAEAAMKLVDHDFMDVILVSMQGGALNDKYAIAYNDYIVESTRACGMGM